MIGFLLFVIYLAYPLSRENALPHPIPMPDLPEKLMTLPAQAQIKCHAPVVSGHDPDSDEDYISIWTYPGEFPRRPDDSAYHPPVAKHGPIRGRITHCAEVQVTDLAWSEFDGEFYVWVEMADSTLVAHDVEFGKGADSVRASGWIRFGVLDFP